MNHGRRSAIFRETDYNNFFFFSAIAQNVLQEGMANEYLISEGDDHSTSSIDFYER